MSPWWVRSDGRRSAVGGTRSVTRAPSGEAGDGALRDGEPGRAVAGLVDALVERLVELEGGEEAGVRGQRLPELGGVAVEECGAGGVRPGAAGRGGVPRLERAGDVVERPEHPRDVAQGRVGLAALGHGPQRLALEVEQHPAEAG